LEGFFDFLHIEADEVAEFVIWDDSLGLHLAKPAKGRSTLLIKESFKEAFSVKESWFMLVLFGFHAYKPRNGSILTNHKISLFFTIWALYYTDLK
jgi:hypothetical protein